MKTGIEPPVALLEPDTVIVVYDSKTGAVRHVHQEVTLPGGTGGALKQQTARAIALAGEEKGRTSAQLKALRVDPTELQKFRGSAFAVDSKAGRLVERKIPKSKIPKTSPRRPGSRT